MTLLRTAFKALPVPMLPALAFLSLCIAFGNPAHAREKTWYKYENSHFEAYSDASEKRATKLLVELENFRGAVLQVANIKVPDGAAKVQVIIFSSAKSFKALIGNKYIAGFAFTERGIPYMALSAGGDARQRESVIRHEYAHILLTYSRIPYPRWFNEGFAELMSATTFIKKGTQFTVGNVTGRRSINRTLTPWNELLAEDFNPHTLQNADYASDAYLQSWFLTHYFMLGNNFENSEMLGQYLALLTNGQPSVDAFEAVVGESADTFGQTVMSEYVDDFVYVIYNFQEAALDHEFQRSEVAAELMEPIIEKLRDRFANK
jgi:hypothetical protein